MRVFYQFAPYDTIYAGGTKAALITICDLRNDDTNASIPACCSRIVAHVSERSVASTGANNDPQAVSEGAEA